MHKKQSDNTPCKPEVSDRLIIKWLQQSLSISEKREILGLSNNTSNLAQASHCAYPYIKNSPTSIVNNKVSIELTTKSDFNKDIGNR